MRRASILYTTLLSSLATLQLNLESGYPYVHVQALSASDLVKKAEGFVQMRLTVEQSGK